MKPSIHHHLAAAAILAAVTALLIWGLSGRNPSRRLDEAAVQESTAISKIPDPGGIAYGLAREASAWELEEEDSGRRFTLALDQAATNHGDGTLRIERLFPPATRASLRARLLELDAQPVAYETGKSRDGRSLRVITRDLRVKWHGAGDMAAVRGLGLVVKSRPAYAPGWVVLRARDGLAALEALNRLRSDPGVITADILLARQQSPRLMPDDPLIGRQWHLNRVGSNGAVTDINAESAWDYAAGRGVRGAGIRIGIVDDGFDLFHQDLAGNFDPDLGWDWNGNDAIPAAGSGDNHGTACAGNAAARGNNGLGGSGAAPEATLVGLRLISSPSTDEQEAEAFAWRNDRIHIKSNSWGPSDTGRLLEEPGPLARAALESACSSGRGGRGTIFVWAAGNGAERGDNSNNDGYANSIHTLAVGAIDSTGYPANYTERGSNIMVCAPSNGAFPALGITTTDRTGTTGYNTASSASGGDYTGSFSGTSSATPLVAGVIALMLEKNPDLGWRDVQEIVMASATKISPDGSDWVWNGAGMRFHPKLGAGVINAAAAVDMAAGWRNLRPAVVASHAFSGLETAIPENDSNGIALDFPLPEAQLRTEHVTLKLSISHASRGNLKIVLTSPSGTSSPLAEVHNDTNDDYAGWTFSSVRHWGENATGNWLLRIADLSGSGDSAGGVLHSAELRVHGAPLIAENPPPSVAIVDPPWGTHFSPGSVVSVRVAATDLDKDLAAGNVAEVVLLSNGNPIASLAAPPFVFSFVPDDGIHQLSARAVDDEGAAAESPKVLVTVSNRPPKIHSASLNHPSQAYADQELQVQSLTASDPDGDSVDFTYQWQWSSDGEEFFDSAGADASILPAAAVRSGRLWRCRLTASDGNLSGIPYTTHSVNLLDRPAATVAPGSVYHYRSGLVLRGVPTMPTRGAIIHEFSQGPGGGTSEWVEILVLKETDLGNWDLSDTNSMLIFKRSQRWRQIPAGSLITIYNGGTARDPALPPDDFDPTDGRLVISSTNTDYFDNKFGSWISLSNSGDLVSLNDASSSQVHALSYGNNSAVPIHVGPVGSGKAARYVGNTEEAAFSAAAWEVIDAIGPVTPGNPNNDRNAAFVTSLRSGTHKVPAYFRLAEGSALPDGLALDSETGAISGTVGADAAGADHFVHIQRINTLGEMVSQSFVLTVGPPENFNDWIAGFPQLADSSSDADPDADGLPNLMEYAMGSSPEDFGRGPRLEWVEGGLSLVYQQSKTATDVELRAEWSDLPGNDSAWSSEGISIELLDETPALRTLRATLPMSTVKPRCFLRLRANLIR